MKALKMFMIKNKVYGNWPPLVNNNLVHAVEKKLKEKIEPYAAY